MVHTSSTAKASARSILRSLCSLTPISIALVSASGFSLPIPATSAGSTGSNTEQVPAIGQHGGGRSAVNSNGRGGASSTMEGACNSEHSYRSTVSTVAHKCTGCSGGCFFVLFAGLASRTVRRKKRVRCRTSHSIRIFKTATSYTIVVK